jgi:hypothetical protein
MGQSVLFDGGCQRAQFLPFRDRMLLAIALTAQIPQPLIMHPFVLRDGDKAFGRFGLVHAGVAESMDTSWNFGMGNNSPNSRYTNFPTVSHEDEHKISTSPAGAGESSGLGRRPKTKNAKGTKRYEQSNRRARRSAFRLSD